MKKILFLIIIILQIQISFAQDLSETSYKIPAQKPKLIIGIVVEQMRQDYIDKYWKYFDDKGIKKLIINGSNFNNAFLNYSLTQSSSGYASIVTGSEPAVHGIVSDYWYNYLTGEKVFAAVDKKQRTIANTNDHENISYSPLNLLATTFSDEAKINNGNKSKVFSISLNPSAAVISGGFTADAAYWFDTKKGKWVTSSYYKEYLPKWLEEINNKKMPDEYLQRIWVASLENEEMKLNDYDTNLYKIGYDGIYKNFPYNYADIAKNIHDYELIGMIPEGNTHLTDLAVATIYNENLGQDEFTDFLFINYSVGEKLGLLFGPQSAEVFDHYLKLDKNIAHLITVVEEVVGKNNIIIYLTSNHGVAEIPQYSIENKMPAGIYKQHYIMALLKTYLKSIYGEGEWILSYDNQQIYLNKTLIEDSHIKIEEFQNKIISFIINSNGISNAISSNQFQNMVFNVGMPQKMQNSFNQKRSGDIMISLRPGWIEDISYSTYHNSGYNYDTHVPLIFYGWKIRKQQINNKVNITDIAPTISNFINTPLPPLSTGTVLENLILSK